MKIYVTLVQRNPIVEGTNHISIEAYNIEVVQHTGRWGPSYH